MTILSCSGPLLCQDLSLCQRIKALAAEQLVCELPVERLAFVVRINWRMKVKKTFYTTPPERLRILLSAVPNGMSQMMFGSLEGGVPGEPFGFGEVVGVVEEADARGAGRRIKISGKDEGFLDDDVTPYGPP